MPRPRRQTPGGYVFHALHRSCARRPLFKELGDWVQRVNRPQTEAELEALRRSIVRGHPYGDEKWEQRTAKELELESTMRERGRPGAVPTGPARPGERPRPVEPTPVPTGPSRPTGPGRLPSIPVGPGLPVRIGR